MRLLNTSSLELSRLFVPSEVPEYAIFSHRWNTEEVTFADLCNAENPGRKSRMETKNGFAKIAGVCEQALKDGYDWIWIDSCCIDKASSAELQEAINSMWRYYAQSNICYVYLADIADAEAGWSSQFAQSEWFTRGWTLQELIAPVFVEFYAKNWDPIGTKLQRYKQIAEITSISPNALNREQNIDEFGIAVKLSWAAHRKVTRMEDESYSLLGLFDVNMPLLYGEGPKKAFIRFQEAIYKNTTDHSIFLYCHTTLGDSHPLLASSPRDFCDRVACNMCLLTRGWPTTTGIRYCNLEIRKTLYIHAYEHLMATITTSPTVVSTVLPLLPYRLVCNRLEFLEELSPRLSALITDVAVLNVTIAKYPQGALCLLLHRQGNMDTCSRLKVLPAALPRLSDLETRVEKTKLLFRPQPKPPKKFICVVTVFSLHIGSLLVHEWLVEGSHSHSLPQAPSEKYPRYKIQTNVDTKSKDPAQVSCHLSCLDPMVFLTAQLVRMRGIWSIKEVFEDTNSSETGISHKLFYSSVLVDRCTVDLIHGDKLLLKLRRLPSATGTDGGLVLTDCYQISIDFQYRTY